MCRSIPQTAYRKTELLKVAVPVSVDTVGVIQESAPGDVGIVLGRTPPKTGASNVGVLAIVVAVAPRSP